LEPFQGYNYEENRTLAPRVGLRGGLNIFLSSDQLYKKIFATAKIKIVSPISEPISYTGISRCDEEEPDADFLSFID
jgi:hypothetical protein